MNQTPAAVSYVEMNFAIGDLTNKAWDLADPICVTAYWSGEIAPSGRQFEARLLWSDTHLYVKFDAEQQEDLIVNPTPDVSQKADGLWERDVCEIFLAPDRTRPMRYFEFEVAPTGEWLDLAIEFVEGVRQTDWEFESRMEAAAKIGDARVTMAFRVPFSMLGTTPERGDVWLGNIFRCVGSGKTRGYLAWRPTRTEISSFHVPEAFGEIEFR